MRTRSKFLTLAAIITGLLLLPSVALAASYTPSGDNFITCVAGGDSNVECTAGVFDSGTDVEVQVLGIVLTRTADADGEISFDFDVPADTPEGDIDITLTGTSDGETLVLSDAIAQVDADGEVIANAGSEAALLAVGAVGALALGGAALYASRRRSTTTV